MNDNPAFRLWTKLLLLAALIFLGVIAYLVAGAPRGLVGFRTAFETLRTLAYAGGIGAALAILTLLVAKKFGGSRIVCGLAALLFAVPVATMAINEASPPVGDFINDITTDLDNPPAFSAVIPLRGPNSNPIEYGGAEVAAVQRQVHPEIVPIISHLDTGAAFQLAFETAESLGWEIIAGDPYTGIIEAVDTTRFFRFKDDVVIRVTPNGTGSRIDMRSRSRVGLSDLGKNAKRIIEYSEAFLSNQ